MVRGRDAHLVHMYRFCSCTTVSELFCLARLRDHSLRGAGTTRIYFGGMVMASFMSSVYSAFSFFITFQTMRPDAASAVFNGWLWVLVLHAFPLINYSLILAFGSDLVYIAPNGNPAYVCRLIEWAFTVPLLRVLYSKFLDPQSSQKLVRTAALKTHMSMLIGMVCVLNQGLNITCAITFVVSSKLLIEQVFSIYQLFTNQILIPELTDSGALVA